MTPKYVVYECENCGRLFYRGVAETLVDDGADCHVHVEVLTDAEGNPEEFPMCGCLGGDAAYTLNADTAEAQVSEASSEANTPSESAE